MSSTQNRQTRCFKSALFMSTSSSSTLENTFHLSLIIVAGVSMRFSSTVTLEVGFHLPSVDHCSEMYYCYANRGYVIQDFAGIHDQVID